MFGRDLWPLLTQGADSPHEHFHYFMHTRLEAIRDARWKLRIARPAHDWVSQELDTGDEPVEAQLFDLWSDPYERFDVAARHPEIVERLRERMEAFARETDAALLEPAVGRP